MERSAGAGHRGRAVWTAEAARVGNAATKPHHRKEMVASGGRESWIREHVGCKELRGVKERSTHCQFRQLTEGPAPWAALADLRPSRGTPYGAQERSVPSDSWPVKPSLSQGQSVLDTEDHRECTGSGPQAAPGAAGDRDQGTGATTEEQPELEGAGDFTWNGVLPTPARAAPEPPLRPLPQRCGRGRSTAPAAETWGRGPLKGEPDHTLEADGGWTWPDPELPSIAQSIQASDRGPGRGRALRNGARQPLRSS